MSFFKDFNLGKFLFFWQTIAIISVREGIIQLGSFNKVFLVSYLLLLDAISSFLTLLNPTPFMCFH